MSEDAKQKLDIRLVPAEGAPDAALFDDLVRLIKQGVLTAPKQAPQVSTTSEFVAPPDNSQNALETKTKHRIGSGVIHEGHIYIHNDPGIAECFDLKTGETVWEQRLDGGTNWSSIMLADGLCYTITQKGDCHVFKASPKFELVATNSLGEQSNSSIVPSDGQLFIRTFQHLWCIGQRK